MDLVLQLADVARPRVGLQRVEGVGLDAARVAPFAHLEAAEEMRDERGAVGGARAEQGAAGGKDGEPVVEAETEAPLAGFDLEQAVGRREYPGAAPPHTV